MNASLPSAANSRRQFLLHGAQALAAGLAAPALAEAAAQPRSETLVQQLHGSLNETQRAALCFAYDDPRRLKVDNNWHIVPQRLRDLLHPSHIDPDLAGELVRRNLNVAHPDEYVMDLDQQP